MSVFFVDTSDERNIAVKELLKRKNQVFDFTWENISNIPNGDTCIFSPAKKFTEKEIDSLPDNINLICGNLEEKYVSILNKKNISFHNLMSDEIFTIKNANLTAEGVLAVILEESKKSIHDNNILILGGGRIARALAILFKGLNVNFSIVSFNPVKFPSYYLYTNSCFFEYSFVDRLAEFDVIINTIPTQFIDEKIIGKVKNDTLFIETASVNCLDKDKVSSFRYLPEPALPMRFSAESAGKVMFESIERFNKKKEI